MNLSLLPAEIQGNVYRPGEDEMYNTEIDLAKRKVFVADEETGGGD